MYRRKILAVWAVIIALTVILVLISAACGKRARQVVQLTPMLSEQQEEDGSEQANSDSGGVLPAVMALDTLAAGTCKSVRSGTQVMSFGADYMTELSGTTSDREYSIEPSGTSLNLRAYAPGDYAYAVYGQAVGAVLKPLQTLIDSSPCNFGGGQDDDIPMSYFVGIADYSLGSWRWFGPFGEVDVMITVNSETLKSRFKSPNDNYYLCVMTTNPGRATSSLSAEGLVADWPFEPRDRATSEDELDPGGVLIEVVVTDTAEGLDTDPAIVTGLSASADTEGVTLTWDTNLDPDVDIYQVGREDPDVADSFELLTGVFAPTVTYTDTTGIPGKEYRYMVRAKSSVGYGGWSVVMAVRSAEPSAPTVLSVSPTSGYSDTATTFTASVSGSSPLTYSWDFGGGATPNASSDESPTVTLGDEGEYDASLTVTNDFGEDTYEFALSVTWIGDQPPAISSVSPTSGITGEEVQFSASVGGTSPLSYSWDFGGGATPNSSSEATPTVTLSDIGEYWAFLTVTNAYGEDFFDFTLTVTAGGDPPDVLSVSPTAGIAGSEVTFSAELSGTPPFTYAWDFGGGATPTISSEATPTVTLGATGEYWASLTVTNAYGEDWFDFTLRVGKPPTISSVSPTAVLSGWGVQFMAEVSGSEPFSYAWDFGGGASPNTSTTESPTVFPGSPGEYEASVTISNDYGEDTFDFTFVVYEPGRGDWWMFGREPTHNHRSPYVGAQTDNVKWRYEDWGDLAIGADGTIYVASWGLYAINREGTLRWQNDDVGPSFSPAIGADGTIYAGAWGSYLYAIYPDGTSKWRYETGGGSSSPAIGADGTVYVGSNDSYLYAINPDGSLKWRYETWGMVTSSPAIGDDGTVYVVGGYHLCAITDDGTEGTLKWNYDVGWSNSSPAIGADGTVYVGGGDNYLYAINPDGSLKWRWRYTMDMSVNSGPAIGADGTIYFGSGDYHVYAVTDNDTEGMLKWRYQTGASVNSSPAIGADGTVYVGSDDGYVYAINPADATLKWSYDTRGGVNSGPAIGADGTIYVGGGNYLYAFGD